MLSCLQLSSSQDGELSGNCELVTNPLSGTVPSICGCLPPNQFHTDKVHTHTPAAFPVWVLKLRAHAETEMLKRMSLLTLCPALSVAHLPLPQVTHVCRVSYSFTYGSALLNEYEIKGGFVEDYHNKIPVLCMSARGRCWSAHVDRHKLQMHYSFWKKGEKKKCVKCLRTTIVIYRNCCKCALPCLLSRIVVLFIYLKNLLLCVVVTHHFHWPVNWSRDPVRHVHWRINPKKVLSRHWHSYG